jgi:DNA-binding NarL/FixJ family response regulator
MVRIFIADDHELVRRGVRGLLETRSDFSVVGEAGDGREACQKILALKPDVAILDISMPLMNGIEAIRRITESGSSTEILALTMHASEALARELVSAGARGYILKTDAAEELLPAVESLALHRSFLTPATSNIVLHEFRRSTTTPNERQKLSTRELETLQLLTEGKTNKEIASLLSLSVRTVETHRANIMAKLHLHSIGELIHYAIRNSISTAYLSV